ncbi:ABC transporter substrate-binding protein [Sporosarcina highlanderae]|uniref:ABC transporter substrate-binding protein n=1 Tax=Sporosarcina highlanderae TaxID=3035916 RepID=A0ABT8JT33_9BACL|nr:ABC transporter substrate-binding protein [Sporosarcina highlanderae]MDN4608157.1 ABC transporter substrate-binding protein [Sporosarcina highlanderae]
MKRNTVLSLLLSVLVLLAACSKEAESSSSPKEIIIGNIGAMSGTSAVNGKAQTQGIEIAVKEINANGGILGAQVKIVTRDDEADPTKSKTFMEEIVDKEKAKFVIGPTNSTPAAASMAYLQENKVISMIPVATGTDLISKNNPYAFRIMPSNEIQAKALVKIAVEEKYKRIALVADTSALGVDGIAVMEKTLKEYGVEPAAKVTYKSDDPDMTPIAQKIKEANADVALFWTLGADGAKIVRSLERIDYIDKLQIIGYTGLAMPNFRELAGPGANNVSVVSMNNWAVEPNQTELEPKYWEMYQKIIDQYGEYGKRDTNPTTVTSGYEAVYLLKWAIEKAGTTDTDEVKKVLENHASEFESVFVNEYAFSEDSHEGFPLEELIMVKISEMYNGDLYIKN